MERSNRSGSNRGGSSSRRPHHAELQSLPQQQQRAVQRASSHPSDEGRKDGERCVHWALCMSCRCRLACGGEGVCWHEVFVVGEGCTDGVSSLRSRHLVLRQGYL